MPRQNATATSTVQAPSPNLDGFAWKTAATAFLCGILLATGTKLLQPPSRSTHALDKQNNAASVSTKQQQPHAVKRRVKKKHHHHHHDDDNDDDDDDAITFECDDGRYEKRTLKLAYERPMAALFPSYEKKFETSSVIVVDENAFAICDSSWSIYKFGLDLQPRAPSNVRFGDPKREEQEEDDSDYEAIFYADGTFYVTRESIQHHDGAYHSIIEEIVLDLTATATQGNREYSIQDQCSTEFEFEGDSKGFEGLWALRDLSNELVLLGLCEGNHCSEEYKDDRGNGRIVKMKKSTTEQGECTWKTVGTIEIPKSAHFADYSAMSIDNDGYIAITSQEDSQLWVGRLLGKQDDDSGGLWDVDNLTFDQIGEIFDFPKDNDCETIYCNIEGIHWLNDGALLAASDKMKKKGKQDFRCREHDQSIHVFVLP